VCVDGYADMAGKKGPPPASARNACSARDKSALASQNLARRKVSVRGKPREFCFQSDSFCARFDFFMANRWFYSNKSCVINRITPRGSNSIISTPKSDFHSRFVFQKSICKLCSQHSVKLTVRSPA
jgi:hypothetical protein